MTTIACDGKSIAADRGMWNGDIVTLKTKVHRITYKKKPAIVAGAGMAAKVRLMIEWVQRCGDKPNITPDECTLVMLLTKDGIFTFDTEFYIMKMETPFFATGTGGAMAHGAMAAGADAKRAVDIVVEHGAGAFGGVDCITL